MNFSDASTCGRAIRKVFSFEYQVIDHFSVKSDGALGPSRCILKTPPCRDFLVLLFAAAYVRQAPTHTSAEPQAAHTQRMLSRGHDLAQVFDSSVATWAGQALRHFCVVTIVCPCQSLADHDLHLTKRSRKVPPQPPPV